MLDATLRPLKDGLFRPLSRAVPSFIMPLHITLTGFILGLASVCYSIYGNRSLALLFWALNRFLDCLDGSVARDRNQQTEWGGFLDLLCDFTVYSLIPIGAASGSCRGQEAYDACRHLWRTLFVVAIWEGVCWLNNFLLFYAAAVAEKARADKISKSLRGNGTKKTEARREELTSVVMRPALVEGTESAVFFTFMLAFPDRVGMLAGVMTVGIIFGTLQRFFWLRSALGRPGGKNRKS